MFNKNKIQTIVIIFFLFVLAVSLGFIIDKNQNKNQIISQLNQRIAELKDQLIPVLPANAEYSEAFSNQCVVGFNHYITPETSLENPMGPVYLTADDKLIGVGYMFTKSALNQKEVITPDKIKRLFLDSGPLMINYKVDHSHIQFIPGGHAALEEDHYDVHYFFVSHEEEEVLKI